MSEKTYAFSDDEINTFLTTERMDQFASELSGLIQTRSESGDPTQAANLDTIVHQISTKAEAIGFKTEILEAKAKGRTFPAMLATHEVDPSAPWVLVYHHADVQPEMDRSKWGTIEPFSGVIKDGVVHGRGATDDKGPLLGTMYALDFLIKNNLLRYNVQIIAETAEESGSAGFKEMAQEAISSGKIRKPSHVFVSDTEFKEGHPTLLATLRGLVTARVGLKLADAAVHSGIAGGVAFNPGRVLTDVLGGLGNPYTLHVDIPGFYDGITTRNEDEAAIRKVAKHLSPEGFMRVMRLHAQAEHDPIQHLIRM
ncbi:M20/M25/M40 family metallo-hydrolase, partial [Candidatus Woesearchaeota archaeon]|nr:M20/M25/M40 family metallo-hydrolase [Candidatus Woesearchaeota archaeon]